MPTRELHVEPAPCPHPPRLPRPLCALAHRAAAFRLAAGRARQLAAGAARRRRVAGAGRGPRPAARSRRRRRAAAAHAGGFRPACRTARCCARASAATLYQAALDRLLAAGARLRLPLQPQRPGRQRRHPSRAASPGARARDAGDPAARAAGTRSASTTRIQGRVSQDVGARGRRLRAQARRRLLGLPARGGGRRRRAGHHRRGARRRPARFDPAADPAAARARPADAALRAPAAGGRRAGPQAVQIARRAAGGRRRSAAGACARPGRHLGQDLRPSPTSGRSQRCWHAAREAFDPARIPADAVGADVIALARDRVI